MKLKKGLNQMPNAFRYLMDSPTFIFKHKLWKGFFDNSWVLVTSVIIASFFSLIAYQDVHEFLFPGKGEGTNINLNLEMGDDESDEEIAKVPTIQENEVEVEEVEDENPADQEETEEASINKDHESLFSGSLKFLLLIFLEVFIFHLSVRTNNLLKGQNKKLVFKDFSKAQIRVIKVMLHKWIYGLLVYILASIGLFILGLSFLKTGLMFLVYGYFLGFAFLDNYMEQYDYNISNSAKKIRTHFGAATVFGVFTSIVMNVPVIGPLVIPFLCSIAATRYAHDQQLELLSEENKLTAA